MLTPGDPAPDFTLPDARGGDPFTLSTAWQDAAALLIFLRHLG